MLVDPDYGAVDEVQEPVRAATPAEERPRAVELAALEAPGFNTVEVARGRLGRVHPCGRKSSTRRYGIDLIAKFMKQVAKRLLHGQAQFR